MNFSILPKTLEYADYLLPFELLYHAIHNLDITKEKKEVLKTRIKDCPFSLFNSCNENGAPLNLTSEEFAALKSLSKNKKLFIKKSDKGNSIAVIDKSDRVHTVWKVREESTFYTRGHGKSGNLKNCV